MGYLRLQDEFAQHPKVIGLSDGAFRLHVTMLCYCSLNSTDGAIPPAALRRTSARHIAELHNAGLWDAHPDGTFAIHDWLKHQRSRAQRQADHAAMLSRVKRHRNGVTNGHVTPDVTQTGVTQDRGQSHRADTETEIPTTGRSWWEHVTGNALRDKALSQQLDDIDACHPPDCVAWAFGTATGKHDPWPYAKRILDTCLLEGHGPRRKEYRNGVAKTQQRTRQRDGWTD